MLTSNCLNFPYCPLSPYCYPDVNSYHIRLSIFLIIGACAGSPALVWALGALRLHYQSRGRVSLVAISLLLSDLLELILNPLLVTYVFDAPCFFQVLIGARLWYSVSSADGIG